MQRKVIPKPIIRLAALQDLAHVVGLYDRCKARPDTSRGRQPFVFSAKPGNVAATLRERILDRCLLVADHGGKPSAAAGIDLERGQLAELMIPDQADEPGVLEPLVVAAERRAVAFGLQALILRATKIDESRFRSLGFVLLDPAGSRSDAAGFSSADGQRRMRRSLLRRQTAYGRRIQALGKELGIPPDYGRTHRLTLQPEAKTLASIGKDLFGRDQMLRPRAATAWRRLQSAAGEDGVELQAVSAWRPVWYQAELLQRKLARGLSMEEILAVSAPPGFSEHHTGCAIDIATPGFPILEEAFENSPAFDWLSNRAKAFGFSLSFSRNNRHRLAYEPWHWRFER